MITEAEQQKLHEEDLERLKSKPVHTARPGRDTFTEHGVESLKHVPFNRHYALDRAAANGLGALVEAYFQVVLRESHRGFSRQEFAKEILTPLAKFERSLVQDRGDEIETLPVWPTDPWSGQKVSNPWAPGTENLTEQSLIEKRDPKLAEMMRERAKGVSFSLVDKLEREKTDREKLMQLKYDHKSNPFLLSGKEGMAAQSAFAKGRENFEVKFFQREANEPVELKSLGGNLTMRSVIAKNAPDLYAVLEAARAVHNDWMKADARRLEQEVQQRQVELQRTQARLAAK
jgi:hypothetical protein